VKLILALLAASFCCSAQLPDFSTWTWVQPEGATLSTSGQWPVLSFLANSGDQHERMLLTSLPAPPYTVTLGIISTTSDASRQSSATLVLRNSVTDKGLLFADEYEFGYRNISICGNSGLGPHIVAAVHVPALTGAALESTQLTLFCTVRLFSTRSYLRIADNGTTRTLYSSRDDMASWVQEFQEASGAFSTFDQVGIGGYTSEPPAFAGFLVSVIYWSLTAR
jgi:hypothetical protein